MKKQIDENIAVNDGNGLFDFEGLIDSIIVDVNDLVKSLTAGQYVQFCNLIVTIIQKVVELKSGVKNDMDSLHQNIIELKQLNDELAEKVFGCSVDKGGNADVAT